MIRFVMVRLLLAIPTLIGVSIILFFILNIAPGGPEAMLIGDQYSAEMAEAARRNLGLDQPLVVQYLTWLKAVVTGDLGHSFVDGSPVTAMISSRLPATLQLAAASLLFSMVFGITFGIIAAVAHNSVIDRLFTLIAMVGVSFPSFWLGIMLIFLFSRYLGWLPSSGIAAYGDENNIVSRLQHLLLPAITLCLLQLAIYMRFTRSAMLEVLGQDYIRTAHAKGLKDHAVVLRHALRNALIPLLTIASFSIKSLIGGAVFVEVVFAWPGLGRLAVDSVYARDYPVVLGLTLFLSAVTIASNLVVDVLYPAVDPRMDYS